MKTNVDIEAAIVMRCAALGLALTQAQVLADAEPFPSDLVHVLGLNPDTLAPLPTKRWLRMAAKTSSVSYRSLLTPDMLLSVLMSGDVPDEYRAHVTHFLDEAPMQLVVMAIEQAAQQGDVPIARIWDTVAQLNRTLPFGRLKGVGKSACLTDID